MTVNANNQVTPDDPVVKKAMEKLKSELVKKIEVEVYNMDKA